MKKVCKIVLWTLGILIGMPLILVLSLYIYSRLTNNVDINHSAYHWSPGMSKEEIEKTSLDLLSQMTIEEKVAQLTGDKDNLLRFGLIMLLDKKMGHAYAGGNKRLDIPPLSFSDGSRGIATARGTCFPAGIARGATWNTDLVKEVGEVIGIEARSAGANYFAGLCMNLLRHPSWGRAQETFGEDPWLIGEMALATIKGVQKHNVMACAKHFALNSIENSRTFVNVNADTRTLHEVYLPHFKKCADNGIASFMSAYNKINGEYCGQNHWLLTSLLRDEWGWDGFVTSDWFVGIYDGEKAAKAGMDIEMPIPINYGEKLAELISSNKVPVKLIDSMVLRVIRMKLDYITRKDPMDYDKDLIGAADHVRLAGQVAEESMVLLKNDNNVLPLNKSSIKKLAVIGRLANVEVTGDKIYHVNSKNIVSPLEGFRNLLGKEVKVDYCSGENIEEAKELAKSSDAVIIIAGFESSEEGEYVAIGKNPSGGDRLDLRLKERDLVLINGLAGLNPKTIVSIITGSAVIIDDWKDKVSSVLISWYGGMEGGNALARIILGEANPSGKLPFSIAEKQEDYPYFNNTDSVIEYGYYHGYTLFDKKGIKPAYPFGFGLSYTTFKFDSLRIIKPESWSLDSLHVSVKITNTGKVSGKEVAQLYIGFENSKTDRPVKLLRGFKKVSLEPGGVQTINFCIPVKELAYYNPESKTWEVEEMTYKVYAGSSSAGNDLLKCDFTVRASENIL
jgi:beta-glucosidase